MYLPNFFKHEIHVQVISYMEPRVHNITCISYLEPTCTYKHLWKLAIFFMQNISLTLFLHIAPLYFQDLHKKREERRDEVKRKAEEEVAYLQASGKITKTPYKTNLGKKKADRNKKVSNKEKDDAVSEPPSTSRSIPQSSQSAQSSARSVSTLKGDQTDSEFEVRWSDQSVRFYGNLIMVSGKLIKNNVLFDAVLVCQQCSAVGQQTRTSSWQWSWDKVNPQWLTGNPEKVGGRWTLGDSKTREEKCLV